MGLVMVEEPVSAPCKCDAYPFPHRSGGGQCLGTQSDSRPITSMPGREHFDSDADYWAAVHSTHEW